MQLCKMFIRVRCQTTLGPENKHTHLALCTLCEGGDGVGRFQLALQEAVLWLGGDFVHQLSVVCVGIHGQQLLLADQVGGLRDIKNRNDSVYLRCSRIYTKHYGSHVIDIHLQSEGK